MALGKISVDGIRRCCWQGAGEAATRTKRSSNTETRSGNKPAVGRSRPKAQRNLVKKTRAHSVLLELEAVSNARTSKRCDANRESERVLLFIVSNISHFLYSEGAAKLGRLWLIICRAERKETLGRTVVFRRTCTVSTMVQVGSSSILSPILREET